MKEGTGGYCGVEWDFSKYTKRNMQIKRVSYELCTPDCPYYCEKHKLKE